MSRLYDNTVRDIKALVARHQRPAIGERRHDRPALN